MKKNTSENKLPISSFRGEIVKAVRDNQVVLITAETGAGKSTQVPQYLLDEGYDMVVTEPRRLAARTVAMRVAYERGEELGEVVGFRTAYERQDSGATRCLFCTDGLALVRELMGQGQHQVLVLDEVHEWNLNIEVLLAWSKLQIKRGVDFKVVVMSATLESERLSSFFGNAPVIEVPGRLFPVEEREPKGFDLDSNVVSLLREGRNVLVFQPGKREIGETIEALEAAKVNAEILPLHGELTVEEQAACFRHYGRPKCVVSTNVAQTSVTIDDIDAVVDSGMERRVELVNGVEGLYLKPISLKDGEQRKGRAGRTKPGIYIDWCPDSDRLDFPKAEILRTRLDQTVLRLAETGFDAEELDFFHQPPLGQILEAKRALGALGCMKEGGEVTRVGRQVAKLPISVQYGRMIVEAERLGVVDDIITVAAILEQGNINARVCPECKKYGDKSCACWRKLAPGESTSDVLAQLAVYKAAKSMTKDEMRKKGVFVKAYFQAKQKRQHLADALLGKIRFGSTGKKEDILRAVCAGMVDHLFRKIGWGSYQNGEAGERQLARESVLLGADWLVGKPWDLQIKTRFDPRTLRLITMASKVDPEWLVEVAPQLSRKETGLNPRYDVEKDTVVSTTKIFFNNQKVGGKEVSDNNHPEAERIFATWLATQSVLPIVPSHSAGKDVDRVLRSNAAKQERAQQLNIRTGEETFKVFSSQEVKKWFITALSGARRIIEIVRPEALELPKLDEDEVASILRDNPDTIEVLGSDLVVNYEPEFFGQSQPVPRVILGREVLDTGKWADLPDRGVFLPSGRHVLVSIEVGTFQFPKSGSIPELKKKVQEHLNHKQWNNWTQPEIEIPNLSQDNPVIPFVTESYGTCATTGEELKAYGTVFWDSFRNRFSPVWTRSESEAQDLRSRGQDGLVELCRKHRKELEKKRLSSEVEEVQEEIREMMSCQQWQRVPFDFRERANSMVWAGSFSIHDLSQWVAQGREFISKLKVEIEKAKGRLLEEEKLEEETRLAEKKLGVLLRAGARNIEEANTIKTFATEIVSILGSEEKAIQVLKDEFSQGRGWKKRHEALKNEIHGLGKKDRGKKFFALTKAKDVNRWLKTALTWLESQVSAGSQEKVGGDGLASADVIKDGLAELQAKFNSR